ncbi:hypothetical protein GNI_070490 [Gregarina niphandrodes]|uniref:START domain protein n=1 Tax=Gregarina niphandrodes TaxID=110365 RepID=A0A023B7C9_GRENI|nr:hypothetical protein GNI_070490 [Gregarina niphandrodes]EZG67210.1 hypothetical protein GNI_070490 [Gregarina niphandrodes]|eukprot:XP_011130299.1 hypothetical protein GNI_070490 [Gregarina niphandrodes]
MVCDKAVGANAIGAKAVGAKAVGAKAVGAKVIGTTAAGQEAVLAAARPVVGYRNDEEDEYIGSTPIGLRSDGEALKSMMSSERSIGRSTERSTGKSTGRSERSRARRERQGGVVVLGDSCYEFEAPAMDSSEYSDDAVLSPALHLRVPELAHLGMMDQTGGSPAAGTLAVIAQGARKAHFEEAYRDEQKKRAETCNTRVAARRTPATATVASPPRPKTLRPGPKTTEMALAKWSPISSGGCTPFGSPGRRKSQGPAVSPSPIGAKSPITHGSPSPLESRAPMQAAGTQPIGMAGVTDVGGATAIGTAAVWTGQRGVLGLGTFGESVKPVSVLKDRAGDTAGGTAGGIVGDTAGDLEVRTGAYHSESVFDSIRQLKSEFFVHAENKDCTVPHGILERLQQEVLGVFERLKVDPMFVVTRRLGATASAAELAGLRSMMSRAEFLKATSKLPGVPDVLVERDTPWWICKQAAQHKQSSLEAIDSFINDIKVGETGGREFVKGPVKDAAALPVVLYGCGALDASYASRLRNDRNNWKLSCDCMLPVYVKCVCIPKGPEMVHSEAELAELLPMVDELASDYRTHLIRCHYQMTLRYQSFIPVVGKADKALLKKAGWNEMEFNGGTCKIRWRTIAGGLILSYMDGYAECPTNKVMCLTFDADNHIKWIPFLSETKRLFATQPLGLCFGYKVALPWPMSSRELTVYGMAADALKVPGLNAVQMWCFNNPKAATSLMGVPLPAMNPKAVDMEIPALAFALSTTGSRTRVQLCAVFDVKVNFLPMTVQNHLAKLMATKMFGNVQTIAKDFDKSDYKKVYERNHEFFGKCFHSD